MLSASEVFAQIISFFILLLLLRIFAWKPILKFLDDRKERIAKDLKDIENAKDEVQLIKSEYENNLAQIEYTAKNKINEAIAEGRKIVDEAKKKAHEEAQDIVEKARTDIKYELGKAKEELKGKIIDLTISATENIIREKLDENSDRRVIKDFLDNIDNVV